MRIAFLQVAFFAFIFANNIIYAWATDFDPLVNNNSAAADANNNANLMRAIKDRNLSEEAQNITILNQNGSTILRGVVKDDREKQTIGSLAAQMGLTNVKNELVIKGKPATYTTTSKTKKPLVITKRSH